MKGEDTQREPGGGGEREELIFPVGEGHPAKD